MKKPHLLVFILLILFFISFEGRLNAQIQVKGNVKGADGTPKISASVKLTGPGNYIALTNAKGDFFIGNVTPGTYKVTVLQGNKYQEFTLTIEDGTLPPLVVNW